MKVSLLIITIIGLVSAKYYPKEYDISLIAQSRTCVFQTLSEGLCAGGNWAQVFAQGLYLSKCVQTFIVEPPLSSQQLLHCLPNFTQDRCAKGVGIGSAPGFIDSVRQYLQTVGLATNLCSSYKHSLTSHLDTLDCPTKCDDGSTLKTYLKGNLREVTTKEQIMDQIAAKGPAIFAIKYTSSFNEYISGEFRPVFEGDYEIEFGTRYLIITGWKTNSDGETIWKGINTFGIQWANSGKIDLPESNPFITNYYVIDII